MQSIRVEIAERSYPVHIGPGILFERAVLQDALRCARVALVTNDCVGPLYAARVEEELRAAGIGSLRITLPDGEAHKTWESLDLIYERMLEARCDRRTVVVALGGGVVGDVAGFAAATFMRGVPLVQLPTTLLAQVDSSVGGKTAINHPRGKNMIGAFHQPSAVLADTTVLRTLPPRELSAGIAEVIKHGMLADAALFDWLEHHMERLLACEAGAIAHVVSRSVQIKASIVALDERETGPRALLNLGHTFGHAIEAGLGFGTWLHGEAVGAGLVLAADLSWRMGRISAADFERVVSLVARARLPVKAPRLGLDRYTALMQGDKKTLDGRLRFIALQRIGQAMIAEDVPAALLRQTLEAHQAAEPPVPA
jgi:3-dehydroquinate synthase